MERQGLLARLEDSNSAEEREACRITAKWIKHFLGTARNYILDLDTADRAPKETLTDPDYMERDSSATVPLGEEA